MSRQKRYGTSVILPCFVVMVKYPPFSHRHPPHMRPPTGEPLGDHRPHAIPRLKPERAFVPLAMAYRKPPAIDGAQPFVPASRGGDQERHHPRRVQALRRGGSDRCRVEPP